ncbi:hypothetical protein T10_6158 [Trichinella papuae]|uniref:Uncharacterized protein n=1 Tax=Trichinella papuae TaxID=268474 RepID=A0A0V1MB40_9BILA|nr:hypothetical protein T10_6158 [Trichinella papuae]
MASKYSLKYRSLMQYFFVLSNSFFLHFPYFSINMMKVVSVRLVLRMETSIPLFIIILFHSIDKQK